MKPSTHNTRSSKHDTKNNNNSKRQKTEDITEWEQNYGVDKNNSNGLSLEIVLAMKIRQYICVMWNYDATDIEDIRNFCPAYLRRVSNEKYEVMDDQDDICFAELLVGGDDGLANIWGTSKEFCDYCRGNKLFYGGYNRATNSSTVEDHDCTP
jgi:hypothetical protein